MSGLKNIVGSELTAYTELLEEARQEAMNRMITKAQVLGADAIVGIRFQHQISPQAHQSFCLWYGGQSTKEV